MTTTTTAAASLADVRVWLPGRGLVLGTPTSTITLRVEGLTLLVGRSGSGASTVLAALADTLPPGAVLSGTVTTPPVGTLVVPSHLPDALVRDLVGPHPDQILLAALGLSVRLADPREAARFSTRDLDPGTRAALAVAWAVGRDASLLLADRPLTRLRPEHRAPVVAALRRYADRGTPVLVAEHVLEDVLPVADTVVELARGRAFISPASRWRPRSLPLPPVRAAARVLGIDRQHWDDTSALTSLEDARLAVPGSLSRIDVGDAVGNADPRDSRLTTPLALHRRETIGVVTRPGLDARAQEARVLDVARRLTAISAGKRVLPYPLLLPAQVKVERLLRAWGRRHRDATPVLDDAGRLLIGRGPVAPLRLDGLRIDPARRTDQHSPGELAALRWALTASLPGARLLVHPDADLDSATRRTLAAHLLTGTTVPHVVISHDPEFLARACHRIVLLGAGEGDDVVGTPALLADHLPVAPSLRRGGLRVLRVRDLVRSTRD